MTNEFEKLERELNKILKKLEPNEELMKWASKFSQAVLDLSLQEEVYKIGNI